MLIFNKVDYKNDSLSSNLTKVVFKVNDIFKTNPNCNYSKNLINGSSNQVLISLDTISSEATGSSNSCEAESITHQIAEKIETVLQDSKFINYRSDLPQNLTSKVAQDILSMSETEPCGLKGCLLYITLEEENKARKIASLKFGEKTIVPTFEMHLLLKRKHSDWLKAIAAKLFKNFIRDTHTLSDIYKLSKKKLFRNLTNTGLIG